MNKGKGERQGGGDVRPGSAEPVDADPRADLVVGPGVVVGPVVQLLVQPGEQGDGAVGQRVAGRLRLGRLQRAVPGALGVEPGGALQALALARAVRPQRVLEREPRVLRPAGRPAADVEVDVRSLARLRVQQRQRARDVEAPVAALRHVRVVPEAAHQPVRGFRVLVQGEAALRDALAEAEVRQRQHDDVEGRVGAAVAGGERAQDGRAFEEAAGPAVDEEQRDRVGHGGLLVEEVDVNRAEAGHVDGSGELGEGVEVGLGLAPVVAVLPVLSDALDICERCPEVPSGLVQFVRESRQGESLLQVLEAGVRDGDGEWLDVRHLDRCGWARHR
nr:hypothetical protein CFP56_34778 [Quercus suber]